MSETGFRVSFDMIHIFDLTEFASLYQNSLHQASAFICKLLYFQTAGRESTLQMCHHPWCTWFEFIPLTPTQLTPTVSVDVVRRPWILQNHLWCRGMNHRLQMSWRSRDDWSLPDPWNPWNRWNRWKMMRKTGYQPWPWGHMENTCLLLLGCFTVWLKLAFDTENHGAQSKVTHIWMPL